MTPTKTHPDDQEQNTHNPSADEFSRIIDSNYSAGEKLRLSEQAEGNAKKDTGPGDNLQQAEQRATSQKSQPKDNLASQENAPWHNEVTPKSPASDKNKNWFKSRRNWAIMGALASLLAGGLIASFGVLAGMLITFKEVNYEGTHKRNFTKTAQRAAKVAEKTYFSDPEDCSGIRCRLRPGVSAKEIKRLEAQGAKVDHRESVKKPNRFVINSITLSDGTVLNKSNFVSQFKSNPTVRGFHATASNSRGKITRTVNVVKKMVSKLGLSRQNPLKAGKNEEDFKRKFRAGALGANSNRLTTNIQGQTNAEGEVIDQDAVANAAGIDQEIQQKATAERERLLADPNAVPSIVPSIERALQLGEGVASGSIRGLRVDGVLQNVCVAHGYIKALDYAAKVYRIIALIRYAHMLMVLADSIKTGDITAEQIAFVMSMLLSTNKEGKNFADSPGWQYLVYKKVPSADSVDRFQSGPSVAKVISNARETIDDVTLGKADEVCNVAQSAPFQIVASLVSVAAAIFTGGGSIVASVGLGAASGLVFGALEAYALPLLIQLVAGTQYSGDEDGYQIGSIVAAGMGALSAQLGRAQGLRPLTKAEFAAHEAEVNQLYNDMYASKKPRLTEKISTNVAFFALQATKVGSLFTPQNALNLITKDSSRASVFAVSEAVPTDVCVDRDKKELATDPFCNEFYSESTSVLMDSQKFDPEAIQDFMINNNYVDVQSGEPAVGENGDEFRNYRDVCMDSTIPLVKSSVDGVETGDYDSVYDYCTSNEDKFTYFRLFRLDMNITEDPAEVDKYLNEGAGVIPGGNLSEVDRTICDSGGVSGTANITCSAYQFDHYGYLWGGGHSGTAEGFMERFKAGGFTPGQSSILDCSGMIRMAIYDAHGVDVGGFTTATLGGHSQFKEVPLEQGQAGDIVWYPGHVELIVKNDAANKRFDTFGAHTAGIPFNEQISPAKFPYSKIEKVYRYVGPTR